VSDRIVRIDTGEVFTRKEDDEMKVTGLNKTRYISHDTFTKKLNDP